MDMSLFLFLHGAAGFSGITDLLIIFIGDYFLYVVLAAVAYCSYLEYRTWGIERLWLYGAAFLAALIARFGVATLIRVFYHRLRPFVALHVPHLLNDTAYSFPSGHTIFIFALATGVFFFNRRLGAVLYGCGLVIGIARIMGGVHYPSDIFGGMILGVLTGWATCVLLEKFVKPLVLG